MKDFISNVYGSTSLYGLQAETVDSLILDFLPPLNHTYCKLGDDSIVDNSQPAVIYLLQELLGALRSNAGFRIPRVSSGKEVEIMEREEPLCTRLCGVSIYCLLFFSLHWLPLSLSIPLSLSLSLSVPLSLAPSLGLCPRDSTIESSSIACPSLVELFILQCIQLVDCNNFLI